MHNLARLYNPTMDAERTIQFLLQTAAQHDERLTRLEASVNALSDLVGRLAQAEIKLVEKLNVLADSQRVLADSQRALTDSLHTTDERLNILVNIVDKLIRRQNGQ